MKPLKDRVLIKMKDSDEVTKGGIVLPDSAKEKPMEAQVIAVGEEVKELAESMWVLISKYDGIDVTEDGVKYVIVREENVLAIL